jgi:hypothetical protein
VCTQRVIEKKNDGTSITTETENTFTKAEEIVVTMTKRVEEIHQVAVEQYAINKKKEYSNGLSQHNRVLFVKEKLKNTQSPFLDAETLLESIQRMTIPMLLEAERKFFQDALLQHRTDLQLPPQSAIHELLKTVKLDFDLYMPFQLYSTHSVCVEVEDKVDTLGNWLHQPEIFKHHQRSQKNEKLREEKLSNGIVWFGNMYIPSQKMQLHVMKEQEKLRDKLASEYVAKNINQPGWKFVPFKKQARMERAVELYDSFEDSRATASVFESGGVWSDFQGYLCAYYITMKLLVGSPGSALKDIEHRPTRIQTMSRDALSSHSFFSLNSAFFAGRENEDLGFIDVTVPGIPVITNVALEMVLLHKMEYMHIFDALLAKDVEKYSHDPVWKLVTPENMIHRGLSCASSDATEKIDKLLAGRYKEDGLVQNELLDIVEKAYISAGSARLASFLPTTRKAQLDQQISRSRAFPELL